MAAPELVGVEPQEEPTVQSLDRRVSALEEGVPKALRHMADRLDGRIEQVGQEMVSLAEKHARDWARQGMAEQLSKTVGEWTREADQRMHDVVDPIVTSMHRLEASVQTLQGIIEGAIGVRWKGPREPVVAPYTRRERRIQAVKRIALIAAITLILGLTVYNTVLDTLLMRAPR